MRVRVVILYVGKRDTRKRSRDIWQIIHDLFDTENPPAPAICAHHAARRPAALGRDGAGGAHGSAAATAARTKDPQRRRLNGGTRRMSCCYPCGSLLGSLSGYSKCRKKD